MSFSPRFLIAAAFALFITITGCAQDTETQQTDTTDAEALFNWYTMEEAQKLAAQNGKKVLVYAEAEWCPYCKQMKSEVFPQESVQKATEEYFYPVLIDIESEDSLTFRGQTITEMEFSRALRVTGTPTFVFFDENGEIIAGQPGFIPEEIYSKMLEFVGTDAYLDQSFEDFAGVEVVEE